MVFNTYTKARILYHRNEGMKAPLIQQALAKEGIVPSRQGIHWFLCRYEEQACLNRTVGSGRPSKISLAVKEFVEEQMRLDDETTANQLYQRLKDGGHDISLSTILRCRASLGWTFRGSTYCQLIRHENKAKRLAFVERYSADEFENVIYTVMNALFS